MEKDIFSIGITNKETIVIIFIEKFHCSCNFHQVWIHRCCLLRTMVVCLVLIYSLNVINSDERPRSVYLLSSWVLSHLWHLLLHLRYLLLHLRHLLLNLLHLRHLLLHIHRLLHNLRLHNYLLHHNRLLN